jgi:hypothetical protein
MGLFGSLFGPSWEERVAPFMREERLPIEERLRLCIKRVDADPADLARGHPLVDLMPYLANEPYRIELEHLAQAMHLRRQLRMPVVAVRKKDGSKWEITVITRPTPLPAGEDLRYRRFENDRFIILNPVDDAGQDLAPCPR